MKFYLRYCCAMCFALISFLLAPPQRAQAQTRKAYVSRSANGTTLTFYYDDQRATRTGTTWGIEETKKELGDSFPEQTMLLTGSPHAWCLMPRSEISVLPPLPGGSTIIVRSIRSKD